MNPESTVAISPAELTDNAFPLDEALLNTQGTQSPLP